MRASLQRRLEQGDEVSQHRRLAVTVGAASLAHCEHEAWPSTFPVMRKVVRRFFESNAKSDVGEFTNLPDVRTAGARLRSEDPA